MDKINAFLTGQGRYVADETVDDALHMIVLRSPVAHGVIADLDVIEARAMPGVRLVLTSAELTAEGVGPIALRAPMTDADGPFHEPHRPVLAMGKVLYVGQPVATVFAETLEQALDAAEAIDLEIDDLPSVTDPLTAEASALIHDDVPQNRAFRWQKGTGEETETLIAGAAHIVRCSVHHPRIAVSPIETRSLVARFGNGRYSLTTPSQGVASLKAALSASLGIDPDALRVMTHDVGGSFAVKIWPYPEHILALVGARLSGRPVRWDGSRSEAFTGDAAGRARIDHGTLALDGTGRFLAFRIEAVADMGAFLSPAAPSIASMGAVRPFAQLYDIEGQHYSVAGVLTNAVPTDAYRGAGKPETTTTLERLIDLAAHQTGMDPFELRERNLIRPERLPLTTPMSETIDAGDFPALATLIRGRGDWDGVAARRAVSHERGFLRGAAIGFQMHATGGSATERSEVRALGDGTVLVRSGAQDTGQSHRESLAIVASEALEIPVDRIRVEQGDSDWAGIAGASGGSNLAPVTMTTVHRTALAMLDRARVQAGEMLEVAEADITYGFGDFRINGTDRTVSLAAVAKRIEEDEGNCMAQLGFAGTLTTWPNGAMICEVEVDPETGGVRVDRFVSVNDLGRIINESAALGQIQGGIAQGIGEALSEGMVFDTDGQPLTASFMDYALPRADDVPGLDLGWTATDSPNTILGAKGVGELSSIGAPGVVVNAVLNALAPHGVRHIDRPLTPLKVWQALQADTP